MACGGPGTGAVIESGTRGVEPRSSSTSAGSSDSGGGSTGATPQGCTNMLAARFAVSNGVAPDCNVALAAPAHAQCTGLTANACAALLHAQPEIGLQSGQGPYAAVFVDDPELHCVDGSRPLFWIDHARHPVTGQDIESDRWLFTFRGGDDCGPVDRNRNQSMGDVVDRSAGGDCWDSYGGAGQWLGEMTTVGARAHKHVAASAGDGGGIHSTLDPNNAFQAYHRVRIHKCTYDRFDGNRVVTTDDFSGARPSGGMFDFTLYFQGRAVISAMMDQLAAGVAYDAQNGGPTTTMPSLSGASRIVLVGHSNGARGLTYSLDGIADELSGLAPNADVVGVLDAGLGPSVEHEACAQNPVGAPRSMYDFGHPDCQPTGMLPMGSVASAYDQDIGFHDSGSVVGDNGNVAFKNWYWNVELDASCLAAHANDATPCHDSSHVMFNHLATPIFVRQALEDATQSGETGRTYFADALLYTWDGGPTGITPYRDRVFAQAIDFATNATTEHDDAGALYTYPRGFFVEGSASHAGATSDVPFTCHELCGPAGVCGGLREVLWTWLETGTEIVAIAGFNGWTWNPPPC